MKRWISLLLDHLEKRFSIALDDFDADEGFLDEEIS